LALCGLQIVAACRDKGEASIAPEGPVTQAQADRYVRKAIRSSNEGVILLPSKKAERVYEAQRLNEIAQGLRKPAAVCFINRAIETIRREEVDGEPTFVDVPEGQIKIRARISPDGTVLRTDVLESGFRDETIEPCLMQAVEKQRWPENQSGHVHHLDVVYWVSLGAQQGLTPKIQVHLRKAQAAAGIRARQCLEGRVDAGTYEVKGLNLVDREGKTIVNRVDPVNLPERAAACIATALKEIGLPQDPDAFIRPIVPVLEFDVQRDGSVKVRDEDWLALIHQEEEALRAAKRAELLGAHKDAPADGANDGTKAGDDGGEERESGERRELPPPDAPPPKREKPRGDPSKGGAKLDLRTRPNG
jgi:hypothetical protein